MRPFLAFSLGLLAGCQTLVAEDTDGSSDTGDTENTDTEETADTSDTEDTEDTGETADTSDTEDTEDTSEPIPDGCRADPGSANKTRAVVVSFPWADGDNWQVLELNSDGDLSDGESFAMGEAYDGEVVFTPDGSLGIVAQNDGSLGIFTLDENLEPTVVTQSWNDNDAFYASSVAMDPSGERAWVMDGNWENNGGGVYEIALDCDSGVPTLVGQTISAKLPAEMSIQSDGTAFLFAEAVEGDDSADIWWFDWLDEEYPWVKEGISVFESEDAIFSAGARLGDILLLADNCAFCEQDNSVAFARLENDNLYTAGQILVDDPVDLLVSPYGDAVLVVQGYDNAVRVWLPTGDEQAPFDDIGQVDYTEDEPELPSPGVVLQRGDLRGLVLVPEVTAIRQFAFDGNEGVEDLGRYDFGDGSGAIPGAIGVQP